MYIVVYIGEVIKKRIDLIESIDDIKLYIFDNGDDLVQKLNGIAVDVFITNDWCMCPIFSSAKMYQNTPVMAIYDKITDINGECRTDLIVTKKTSNLEFRKYIDVLLKLKTKNDEKVKNEILHNLEVKDSLIKISKIYDAMSEGIIITNDIGQVVTINKAAKLICNYSQEEIKHIDSVLEIYVNNIKTKIFIDTINTNHKIILNSNVKLYITDDKYIHVSLTSSKLTDNIGNLIGILVIFQDITKEYKILTKLQNSEESYKRIYNNAPDIIYTHDVEGHFTSINRASDFGYNIGEVVGHNIGDFMDGGNLNVAKNHMLAKINDTDKTTEYEINVLHKDGYPIRLEIKSILNKNKYGEYEIFSTARNITDKVDSRKQIQLEQERYKQMFFNTKSSVIIFKQIGNEFQIIDFNNKGELIDIIQQEDIKFKNILDLHAIYYQLYEYLKIIQNGKRKNYRVDEFKYAIDSDEVYLNLFLYKLKHSDEIIMIYDNITEIKLLLNQYEEAKNKATESDHLKSMFLSNISHEIRTPMNAIKGFSSQLKDNIDDDGKRPLYAKIIHESTEALLNILNDILEISMIENGTINIVNDYFYINDLLDELKQETIAILREKKKMFILLNIIKPDISIELCSDLRRIKQILLNIIDNAIKFTDKGVIEVTCKLDGDYIDITVKDTGIGIRNDELIKVFDRFYKVYNKRLNSGTGLGLSISKQLSHMLGGDISIESVFDEGTILSIKIPIYRDKTILTVAQKTVNIDWSDKKILIVEDKAVNYRLLEMYLEHTNVDVIRAKDGSEFYSNFSGDFDLVLLDIQLPDTNGFEILKWLRKNNHNVPVIIQTAFASREDEQKSYKLGANSFMTKPIKKNPLLDEVAKFI